MANVMHQISTTFYFSTFLTFQIKVAIKSGYFWVFLAIIRPKTSGNKSAWWALGKDARIWI